MNFSCFSSCRLWCVNSVNVDSVNYFKFAVHLYYEISVFSSLELKDSKQIYQLRRTLRLRNIGPSHNCDIAEINWVLTAKVMDPSAGLPLLSLGPNMSRDIVHCKRLGFNFSLGCIHYIVGENSVTGKIIFSCFHVNEYFKSVTKPSLGLFCFVPKAAPLGSHADALGRQGLLRISHPPVIRELTLSRRQA